MNRTYNEASYHLANRISRDPALAQDIVQEAFIKVINSIHLFRHEGSFAGWVRRIVVGETINRIKAQSRLYLVNEQDHGELESAYLFDVDWLSACRDLDTLLSQLTPTARAVLLLHEVEGFKHQEIAELYGKSVSFSKITLNRAYAQLKNSVLNQEQHHAFK